MRKLTPIIAAAAITLAALTAAPGKASAQVVEAHWNGYGGYGYGGYGWRPPPPPPPPAYYGYGYRPHWDRPHYGPPPWAYGPPRPYYGRW